MKTLRSFITQHDSALLTVIALIISTVAIWYYFHQGVIVAYGDSESHLNIAKRVVASLTPGLAQLGGIWLPLPHVLMIPFVYFDELWRTGLAGSIVSGIAFVVSAVFIYKIVVALTKKKLAGLIAFLAFVINPNILYMQSTPMTEQLLICFFILSTYYFYKFIANRDDSLSLLASAFFSFAATLTRYDGWFLVLLETLCFVVLYIRLPLERKKIEGRFILFATLAYFGIGLWLLWNLLILGNPFYFTSSPFSAKSQQQSWLAKGELVAYKNLWLSVLYYAVTAFTNVTIVSSILAVLGLFTFSVIKTVKQRALFLLVLSAPFLFYVVTLYIGQSVIFIPSLTPKSFEYQLFNVRYGLMMVPVAAVLIGALASYRKVGLLIASLGILFQVGLTLYYPQKPITLQDGVEGLSSAKIPDAQKFMNEHYDKGLVLMDDYARTMSIIRSTIPMQNMIYIGNKPYWDDSLYAPEKYARWIVMQKNDAVWKAIYDEPDVRGRLFKYFKKAYTSPEILIFQRNEEVE